MKNNRLITNEEGLARTVSCIRIRRQFNLTAVPRMFDYQANGEIWIAHALPKQNKIRLAINSCADYEIGKKILKNGHEQAELDITFKNAEELIAKLTHILNKNGYYSTKRSKT